MNIHDTWVKIGDCPAFEKFGAWAEEQSAQLNADGSDMMGGSTFIDECYTNACKPDLQKRYARFLEEVAELTGGECTMALIKGPFRAKEKTAMRHDLGRRFKSDNLYDVKRGSISYPNMEAIHLAAKAICDHPDFVVLRLKDRFTTPTSSEWRDVMINGYFQKGRNKVRAGSSSHALIYAVLFSPPFLLLILDTLPPPSLP